MVCRLNNLTRAAERLHVAQPAISVAIQKLEEELGVSLFDRSQKQFMVTPEGKVFLARVEEILNRAQDAQVEMAEYRELRKGAIKIGVPPMIGGYLFPHIFAGFRNMYPQLELTVIEDGSLAIRDKLEREEMDLGIIIISQPSPLIHTVAMTRGEIMLCLPPRHPLAGRTRVSFSELKDEPFILLKEDSYHRQIILQACRDHGFDPKIVLSSGQIETIKGLVAQGVGISFLADFVVRKDPDIQVISVEQNLSIEIGLAWKRDKYLSKASQAFVNFAGTLVW